MNVRRGFSLTENRRRLLGIARDAGRRLFDPRTGLCLIPRETVWYAIGMLFDEDAGARERGAQLLAGTQSVDGTHTPATLLALLHSGIPLPNGVRNALMRTIRGELTPAAMVEWHDGNVNHPLGAWATLVLGGEAIGDSRVVEIGRRRLEHFLSVIGGRSHAGRRQAEMSEYNSPTYTALDLCFLAILAEHARDERARQAALALEHGVWTACAMHYHAPSGQFAGPHSRAYQDDSCGGYSGLHCALSAATDVPVFLDTGLADRFDHPSTHLQNALIAISPFHVPDAARLLLTRKPFPYTFRMTTYGEAYHENNAAERFDAEAYPGGWTELTTHLTDAYALGTAATPYVNGAHCDSISLRIARAETPGRRGAFRSMFTRAVFNGAEAGQRNRCHVTGGEIDASYLYEEGRPAVHQHRDRAIVLYAPKRAGHRGIESFRVDLLFWPDDPFDALIIGGKECSVLPYSAREPSPIILQDRRTYLAILPLHPAPVPDDGALVARTVNGHIVFSLFNYAGPSLTVERDALTRWRNGFVLLAGTVAEYATIDAFSAFAGRLAVTDSSDACGVRVVTVHDGMHEMACRYDPLRERFLSRAWDGAEETLEHFEVDAAGERSGPFAPAGLYRR